MTWDGLNRRKFPRVNYPCLVIVANKDGEKESLLTHTENIGIGGICVILKQNLAMFAKVTMEIDLLDLKDHIRCLGKVVWNVRRKNEEDRKPLYYDIGIEFDNMNEKDQKRLEEVIGNLVKNKMETSPYRTSE